MFLEALHKSPALRTKNPCFPPSDLKMSDGGEMGLPVANHSGSPRVSGLSSTGRRTMSCKCLLLTSAILVGWGLLGGYTFLILERDDEQLRIESAMPLENYMEDFLGKQEVYLTTVIWATFPFKDRIPRCIDSRYKYKKVARLSHFYYDNPCNGKTASSLWDIEIAEGVYCECILTVICSVVTEW